MSGGYGNPPKKHQFKKGRSGNPKGRPKGTKNLRADILSTLKTPIHLTIDGKLKKVSTQKAVLLRLREKALKGDQRAVEKLLTLAAIYNDDDDLSAAHNANIKTSDAEIIAAFEKRKASSQPRKKPKESGGSDDEDNEAAG